MDSLESVMIWEKFGLAGLVIGALFFLVVFLIKENRATRREFTLCITKMSEQSDTRQAETNRTMSAMALVIEKLLIEIKAG